MEEGKEEDERHKRGNHSQDHEGSGHLQTSLHCVEGVCIYIFVNEQACACACIVYCTHMVSRHYKNVKGFSTFIHMYMYMYTYMCICMYA